MIQTSMSIEVITQKGHICDHFLPRRTNSELSVLAVCLRKR